MKKFGKLGFLLFALFTFAICNGFSAQPKPDKLAKAAAKGKKSKVESLLKKGADVNAKNKDGDTAINFAVQGLHTEVAELLVENGADLEVKDKKGNTMLILAVRENRKDKAELLIRLGANVNAVNNNGWTALMYAAKAGFKDLVRLLLKNDADREIQTKDEWTALKIAEVQNHNEIVELLKSDIADILEDEEETSKPDDEISKNDKGPSEEDKKIAEAVKRPWDLKILDTARNVDYLSDIEKDIILEMNKARTNPIKYAEENIKPLMIANEDSSAIDDEVDNENIEKQTEKDGDNQDIENQENQTEENGDNQDVENQTEKEVDNQNNENQTKENGTKTNETAFAIEECIADMRKRTETKPFVPMKGLSSAAQWHAKTQSENKTLSHKGTDGTKPYERMAKFGTFGQDWGWGENMCSGPKTGKDIVVHLLIDDGVPSRIHRHTILNETYSQTGCALYEDLCVIDYAYNYKDNEDEPKQ